MLSLRNVIAGVVLVALQAGPAIAQSCTPGPGCLPGGGGGGAAVPGPEVGIGILGLLIAGGAVRYLRDRAKR